MTRVTECPSKLSMYSNRKAGVHMAGRTGQRKRRNSKGFISSTVCPVRSNPERMLGRNWTSANCSTTWFDHMTSKLKQLTLVCQACASSIVLQHMHRPRKSFIYEWWLSDVRRCLIFVWWKIILFFSLHISLKNRKFVYLWPGWPTLGTHLPQFYDWTWTYSICWTTYYIRPLLLLMVLVHVSNLFMQNKGHRAL